jgi:hypothetical protein
LAQNQTAFENQKSQFYPAGGQKEKEKLSPQYSIVEWLCVGCGDCTCAWGCCLQTIGMRLSGGQQQRVHFFFPPIQNTI